MPGRNSGDNKYAYSPFIVGPVLGDGCNYSTIQSAINDAFAAGGGEVLIKPGTYNENLILQNGVDLIGAEVDGRIPAAFSHIVINGNMTFSLAAGFGISIAKDITFTCAAGDLLTMTATLGAQIIFACKFSGLDATTNPASRAVVFNPDGTSFCQFSTDNTNISSSSHTFEGIGAGACAAILGSGSSNSNSGDLMRVTTGTGSLICGYTTASSGATLYNNLTGSGTFEFSNSLVVSADEVVLFPAAAGQCIARHSTISCNSASGFWIDGTGGSVEFVDIALLGASQGIGAAISQTKYNWQPYGETSAAASGSNRGTSSYDSAQFTVTDGWVQITNPTGLVWTDQALATVVTSFSGSFVTATITLTLPAVPAQGDVVAFKVDGAFVLTIQANVGQTIKIGNMSSAVTGTATGSDDGDALHLTYRAASSTWIANSVIGNWTLA